MRLTPARRFLKATPASGPQILTAFRRLEAQASTGARRPTFSDYVLLRWGTQRNTAEVIRTVDFVDDAVPEMLRQAIVNRANGPVFDRIRVTAHPVAQERGLCFSDTAVCEQASRQSQQLAEITLRATNAIEPQTDSWESSSVAMRISGCRELPRTSSFADTVSDRTTALAGAMPNARFKAVHTALRPSRVLGSCI